MSVEKEQFEKVMGELRRACLPAGAADVIQAYVDAQGAVLARVEASAATLGAAGRGAWGRASTAQAQLAEVRELLDDAAELLSHFKDGEPYEHEREDLPGRVDAYLERLDAFRDHSEQQESLLDRGARFAREGYDVTHPDICKGCKTDGEIDEVMNGYAQENQKTEKAARGAQAEDAIRLAAFEDHWYSQKYTAIGSTEAQRHFDAGWQARAALATQPAVPGEYPAGAIENGRTLLDRLEQCYGFRDAQGHLLANCAEWLEARLCFEHLVGLILTRPGVEVFGWYWKRRFRGEVVNSGVSVGSRKPELGEETFGKHRTSTEYIALAIVEPAPAAEKAR
ncbi:hypothetical protein BJP27_24385 (plasmid) [Pseudomonas oryzihabitans]|nr:hypothetical protein BJP27_24385 [Pseudomonas psychrotolerans]